MRVIAMEQGFYNGARRRPGDVFDMNEKDMKEGEDGARVLPAWVLPDTEISHKLLAKRQRDAHNKFAAGAIAASAAGASGKSKKAAYEEALHAGRGPQRDL